MKDFYENTYYDLLEMSSDNLIKIAQEYNVTDYSYNDDLFDSELDSLDDCINNLKWSIMNHINTFNDIKNYIKSRFSEELISLNLRYGEMDFIINTDLYDFKFNIRKNNICDDLLIGVKFKNERPDEYRDDRDRSKKISGVCTIIAEDKSYGNDDEELEYKVYYDKIYDFIKKSN